MNECFPPFLTLWHLWPSRAGVGNLWPTGHVRHSNSCDRAPPKATTGRTQNSINLQKDTFETDDFLRPHKLCNKYPNCPSQKKMVPYLYSRQKSDSRVGTAGQSAWPTPGLQGFHVDGLESSRSNESRLTFFLTKEYFQSNFLIATVLDTAALYCHCYTMVGECTTHTTGLGFCFKHQHCEPFLNLKN